jgi:hypothetical protein
LETNYDHWQPVPDADDRRTPGNANMAAIGQQNLTTTLLKENVMKVWPTYNHHTDYTGIFSAADGTYESYVWMGQD